MKTDIVIGLSYGDEGKGKVTHSLLKHFEYTHCIRFNGGCNAGHTIYHEGKKFVTHHIPAGVFFGVKSIIGNGCVLDPVQFFKELKYLNDNGVYTDGLIYVAHDTHIITNAHKEEDSKDTKIGTTRTGNGPAYRDKYNRTGVRAESIPELKPYLIDVYEELHTIPHRGFIRTDDNKIKRVRVLCEGAQGFGIDVSWGNYPYVTSSHCGASGALLNGISHRSIDRVYGVCKAYDTYVGANQFEPNFKTMKYFQELGKEYGATTGRRRQVNYLDLDFILKSCLINGVTDLIINKVDVLKMCEKEYQDSNPWCVLIDNFTDSRLYNLGSERKWKEFVIKFFRENIPDIELNFSESPHHI